MAKATAQQCHALTTYYIDKYSEVVGKTPSVNRNKSKWGFEAMLIDYTPTQAREMIDHYIEHYASAPTIEWFLFNYEKVDEAKKEFEERKVQQAKRMAETKARAEEWRNRWQQTK
jgi:hypothetical protein